MAVASPAVMVPRAESGEDPPGGFVLVSPVHGAALMPSASGEEVAPSSEPSAPPVRNERRVPVRPRRPRPAAIVASRAAEAGTTTDPQASRRPDVQPTSTTSVTAAAATSPATVLAPVPSPPLEPAASPAVAEPKPVEHARPWQVSVSVASELRVEDEFPSWPEGLSRGQFPRAVMLEVCVSELGAVREVRFTAPAEELLRQTLERSVRRWRYRALMMGGRPRAFCHPLRIEYRHG